LLALGALVVANLALWWLLDAVMLATGLSALIAMVGAFSAGAAIWSALGVVAAGVTALAMFGPLFRHWSPSRTWLTMLTAMAVNLGVILVLLAR
jgi:hypothetical protein